MALVNESSNEFDFELQRLSGPVHRRYPEQCDTLAAHRMEDRIGVLNFLCRACRLALCGHKCNSHADRQRGDMKQQMQPSEREHSKHDIKAR